MGTETKIQWADSTWSPWRGCTKVSPGCANCYAETLAKRNPAVMGGWGKGAPRVLAKNWDEPAGWNRKATQRFTEWNNRWDGTMRAMFKPKTVPDAPNRPTVFPSLCDWLDDEVPTEWLARFLQLIWDTPSIDWLLLTKRPELWAKRLLDCIALTVMSLPALEWHNGTPPPNVWFGVSAEPLLSPINIAEPMKRKAIDWVVVGGESGPKARECHADWIRSLVRQCQSAEVPVFVKQVGSRPIDRSVRAAEWGVVKDPKGGDPNEWPMDLCVRQFPER